METSQNGLGQAMTTNGYYDPCAPVIMGRVAELGDLIKDAECNTKDTIHAQSLAMSAEFCATNKNTSDRTEKVLEKVLENRYFLHDNIRNAQDVTRQEGARLAEKVDRETDVIKERLSQFERSVDKEFCGVKTLIKEDGEKTRKQLFDNLLDEKNDEILKLRTKFNHQELINNSQFVNYRLSNMETSINSMEQTQKFGVKTTILGNANVTPTSQSAQQL